MTAPATGRRLLDTVVAHPATVVEASAGTGKTYQLEHLVFDLVAEDRARLDEILVVTFTERATNELVTRIRRTIDAGLGPDAPRDPGVRARLHEARRSFDLASITTIHAFCQGLLMDEPFLTGRLLGQSQVDGRAAFGEVFRETLRAALATEQVHRRSLEAYLAINRDVEGLESLLYRAATARGRWAFPHEEAPLAALAAALLAIDLASLEPVWKRAIPHPSSLKAFKTRLQTLWPVLAAARAGDDWLPLLAVLDREADENFHKYLNMIAGAPDVPPALGDLGKLLSSLSRTPTVIEAVIQMLLPTVSAAVERKKLGQGLYDFDDMIGAIARALDDAATGDLLAEKLRRRYRYALIDEAQDTEETQWRLFDKVFLRSGGTNPVVLIGDPKQAIYGFRGADVHTYVAARTAIRARGGAEVALDRNFRSASEVVRAVNAILDQAAAPAYFTDRAIAYDHPVTSERGSLGAGAGVTLLKLDLPERPPRPLPVGAIKRALRHAISDRIALLLRDQPALRPSAIFVLTRTNVEAREVGAALGEAGIAHSFYKQEGLWKLPEAAHVRALLCAIADPSDRVARLHAWLTPFFGATLSELEALGDPPAHHPLMRRLQAWKALADARDYPALWASVFESSGLGPRHLFARPSRRRLGLYRQIAGELLAEAAARPQSAGELAATLGRYATGQFPVTRDRAPQELDIQRADLDDDAVQIMTMHRAKGLEAAHVFLYGALTGIPIGRSEVHPFRDGDDRVFCAGKPRHPGTVALIKAHRSEEDQRLLYVAMTRARDHLYMPFFPATDADDDPFTSAFEVDHGDYVAFNKITGAFLHVNQRLRELAIDRGRFAELFRVEAIPFPAPERAPAPDLPARIAAWSPPAHGSASDEPAADAADAANAANAANAATTARLRASRRGFVVTSYSRLKDAEGGYQPPQLDEDAASSLDAEIEVGGNTPGEGGGRGDGAPVSEDRPDSAERARADELPGGAATGLFLHAVLEKVTLGALPPLGEWEQSSDVQRLLASEFRRWDRDPRYLGAAARMVHAALTAPIVLPGAPALAGIATAPRVRREVDFLFPMGGAPALVPPSPTGEDRIVHERGFIRGVLDVLFEHEGRACFADWKSDFLPDFSTAAVMAHVRANYDLQIRIYTVAVMRLLGVHDQTDYERRFGGLVYLFLRGVRGQSEPRPDRDVERGIHVLRPTYDEVRGWERELTHATPAGPAGRR